MNVHVLHLRLTQNNAWNIIDIPSIYIYIYIYILKDKHDTCDTIRKCYKVGVLPKYS